MFSLFEFAVGVRLLMFVVFVACVYGGMPCLCIWNTAKQSSFGSLLFCDALFNFLLLVTYVVWFVFYFGLNA